MPFSYPLRADGPPNALRLPPSGCCARVVTDGKQTHVLVLVVRVRLNADPLAHVPKIAGPLHRRRVEQPEHCSGTSNYRRPPLSPPLCGVDYLHHHHRHNYTTKLVCERRGVRHADEVTTTTMVLRRHLRRATETNTRISGKYPSKVFAKERNTSTTDRSTRVMFQRRHYVCC